MEIVLVAEQDPDVPVTVYIVAATGETVTVPPERFPGNHEYVVAPEAVNCVDPPLHTVAVEVLTETIGNVLTTTVIVFVSVQVPVVPTMV
jgi:hypothetical protein